VTKIAPNHSEKKVTAKLKRQTINCLFLELYTTKWRVPFVLVKIVCEIIATL